jgi:sulfur carrier protein
MTPDRGSVQVTVNGDDHAVAAGATVADLVAELGHDGRGIAVAIDGEVVTRGAWRERKLVTGESIDVLSIAQGG